MTREILEGEPFVRILFSQGPYEDWGGKLDVNVGSDWITLTNPDDDDRIVAQFAARGILGWEFHDANDR